MNWKTYGPCSEEEVQQVVTELGTRRIFPQSLKVAKEEVPPEEKGKREGPSILPIAALAMGLLLLSKKE